MALNLRSLALFASAPYGASTAAASKVNFYVYATTDAIATVETAGYFNDARDKLQVNDVIIVLSTAGGTGALDALKVTAAPASGNVTVSPQFAAHT